ncbi:hypothetical protein J3R82DRAFT_7680 [Butyriboletus roseoflavus]|nr:hypothetical protein J3R82DRAFT_7680 [Butyriboletus roseoflavus]
MTSFKATYNDQGYVLVPDLIPPDLIPDLCTACDRAIAKTRTGAWPHRRTVGKQFPPFDDTHPDSWGVQHVMHPALGEPVFARWYTSESVRNVAKALLECEAESLQMELFNLLINPLDHDFALRWHRDDVRENATAEEELKALASWSHGVQWNTRLFIPRPKITQAAEDRRTARTLVDARAAERPARHARRDSTHAPTQVSISPLPPLSKMAFLITAGESVFYNSNILHCATYDAKQRRATLHASMGDTRGGSIRARNVLQHGLLWMKEAQFRDTLDEKGQSLLDALIEMQNGVQGDVGYSLTG